MGEDMQVYITAFITIALFLSWFIYSIGKVFFWSNQKIALIYFGIMIVLVLLLAM